MFIIFLIIAQAIILLFHYVVFRVITALLPVSDKMMWVIAGVFFILSISFFVSTLIAYNTQSEIGAFAYKISAIWLGVSFILFIMLSLAALLYFVFPTMSSVVIVSSALVFSIIAGVVGVYNAFHPRIVEVTITLPHIPATWEGKRAVFFADTHFGNIYGVSHAQKLVEQIKKINPDIVFMAGDFFDGPLTTYEKDAEPFGTLQPKDGKYFVTGNHEEYGDETRMIKSIAAAGFTVLNNEKKTIEGVQIVGLDYTTNGTDEKQKENLSKISVSTSTPSILLKHVPLALSVARDAGISLQLSGHTHRGQMWPFSLITKRIYQGFDYGLHTLEGETNSLQIYTTSGTHTWGPPLRLGTQSEIVVITFKGK
jgi:uncharacterized protein